MSFFHMFNSMPAALGLAALLSASPAAAQTAVRVQIPFDFHAGDRMLPPGMYVVTVDPLVRWVDVRGYRSVEGVYLGGATVHNPNPSARGVLLFNRYGEKYFLRSVALAGRTSKHQFAASRAEREMAKGTRSRQFAQVIP